MIRREPRCRPRSRQGDGYNIYEREMIRELYRECKTYPSGGIGYCKAKSTNRIARNTDIAWQTANNYLNDLYQKGMVSRKKTKNKTLWKLNI